jgi:hypothetical protein
MAFVTRNFPCRNPRFYLLLGVPSNAWSPFASDQMRSVIESRILAYNSKTARFDISRIHFPMEPLICQTPSPVHALASAFDILVRREVRHGEQSQRREIEAR